MSKISDPISQTAVDALQAKLSLITMGYSPVKKNFKLYASLLYRMESSVSSSSTSTPQLEHQRCKIPPHQNDMTTAGTSSSSLSSSSPSLKRQTPFINASYAVRVSIISFLVEQFLSLHGSSNSSSSSAQDNGDDHCSAAVNILILGGGLDLIGLWSTSLGDIYSSTVNLYEVDCERITAMKRDMLLRNDDIFTPRDQSSGDDKDGKKSFSSLVALRGTLSVDNGTSIVENSVTLLSADLRCIDALEKAISEAQMDATLPTLILSELVLAYLGDLCVDNLLTLLSSAFSNPALVLYEPFHDGTTFASQYYHRFATKVRGQFSPFQKKHLWRRFETLGFRNVVNMNAASALNAFLPDGIVIPELFDEHAALLLHLRCYGVSMTLPSLFPTVIFREGMGNGVRLLFERSYAPFKGRYKGAIDRMVMNALRGDLSGEGIGEYYRRRGGAFWVFSGFDNKGSVTGCIGLRECGETEDVVTRRTRHKQQLRRRVFEVQRWVVAEYVQGWGVGSLLLNKVLDFVEEKGGGDVVAMTPTVTTGANLAYKRNGFEVWEERQMGELVMKTFGRSVLGV